MGRGAELVDRRFLDAARWLASTMAHIALYFACLFAAAWQLRRVPRLWALLFLFIALMPKLAVATVPGNTTPIRIDDLVVGAALAVWFFRRREAPPASSAGCFLRSIGARRLCRRSSGWRR